MCWAVQELFLNAQSLSAGTGGAPCGDIWEVNFSPSVCI